MFESFLQDIRVGFRVLLKEKSFCFLAVLVLALGIGGVTTHSRSSTPRACVAFLFLIRNN